MSKRKEESYNPTYEATECEDKGPNTRQWEPLQRLALDLLKGAFKNKSMNPYNCFPIKADLKNKN